MKFGTLINCIDGRVQYPVMDYLNKTFDIDYFDAANEAGPLLTLTKKTDKCRLISLKEQIRTSLEEHDSSFKYWREGNVLARWNVTPDSVNNNSKCSSVWYAVKKGKIDIDADKEHQPKQFGIWAILLTQIGKNTKTE